MGAFALVLAPLAATAQVTNPQDPMKWEVLPTIRSGMDMKSRTEEKFVNGVRVLEHASYAMDWNTGVWHRNGVPLPGTALTYPFSKAVPEPDSLTCLSEGSETYRLRWKQTAAPPPAAVGVYLSTGASAIYGDGGSATIEGTGFEVSRLEGEVPGLSFLFSGGRRSLVIPVNGGIASITLNKRVAAQDSAGWHQPATADGSAQGGSISIDPRMAFVFRGQPTRLKVENDFLSAYLHWEKNETHNEFRPQPPKVITYNRTSRIPVLPTYSAVDNKMAYDASMPIQKLQYQFFPWGVDHERSSPQPVTFSGFAMSEHQPGESYRWNFDHTRILLPSTGGYTIAPHTFWGTPHLLVEATWRNFFRLAERAQRYFYPSEEREIYTSLEYTWKDGRTYISNQHITLVPPTSRVLRSQMVLHERPQAYRIPEKGPFGQPVYSLHPADRLAFTGLLFPVRYELISASNAFGVMAAVFGSAAYIDEKFEIPAGIAAIFGIVASEFDNTEGEAYISQANRRSTHTWWYTSDGLMYTEAPPSWHNPSDWTWMVAYRDSVKRYLTVEDKWDLHGYAGRFVVPHEKELNAQHAPKLFYFFENGGGPDW